jgi:hypothetical protein
MQKTRLGGRTQSLLPLASSRAEGCFYRDGRSVAHKQPEKTGTKSENQMLYDELLNQSPPPGAKSSSNGKLTLSLQPSD